MTDNEHDLMMQSFEIIYFWLNNNNDQQAWRMYGHMEREGIIKAGDIPTENQMQIAKDWYLTTE